MKEVWSCLNIILNLIASLSVHGGQLRRFVVADHGIFHQMMDFRCVLFLETYALTKS